LEWDTTVPHKQIQVKVDKGAVTLTGEVDWDYQRNAAKTVIQRLYGVRSVTNKMTLKSRVQPDDIHRRIQDALERQGQIKAGDVRVTVDGGKVRLDGKVEAWHDRSVIERATWAAPGVYAVEDKVTVNS
jgi:osmotically-inducible protein OsmY